MADEEEGRSTAPASGVGRPTLFSSPATSSQATPYAKAASDSTAVGADEAAAESSGPTAYTLPLEGGKGEVKGSDLGGVLTPDVRALAALRPVEAMLHDPLSEVARKERRSLLGISVIATAVGWTGVLPEKIENLGITFAAPARQALLWVFVAVVLYYTLAFIVYSFSDFLSYLYAVHRGRIELRKQRQDRLEDSHVLGEVKQPVDTSWPLVGYVTLASLARGVFDFIVPLLVAFFAMWFLWGAVAQVKTTVPAAPATSPAPSLKAAPAPATR